MNVQEKYKKYVNTAFVKGVEPVVVVDAKGATITDEDGRLYTDLFSGIAVVNAGHCNPEVIASAKAQMDKLVHCGSYVYHVPQVADLAEKIARNTPGRLQKSFFGSSGAEAIECGLRLAKQFTKKQEFVSLQGSFHGRSLATLSITGNSARKRGGGPYLSGCTYHPSPYCYRCHYAMTYPACEIYCAKDLENTIVYSTSDNVAAFIAEPVLGEGGIIVPPGEYFKEIKKVLDKRGILFFADEVQTGFGRTGKMFAVEHYDVEPDIMAMAKGIADGFPLSCLIAREDVADSFKPGDHLSTFGGNPVSCAAALANIAYLEKERLEEKARDKGGLLMEALRDLQKTHKLIGDVRGAGLMIGIELVRDSEKTPAAEEAVKIRIQMREHGFLVGVGGTYGNVIRIQPPLVISEEDLQKAVKALDASLKAL